ncbi:MAG: DUF2589 domain-containing protein [Muribaculaceae bacterium]
MKLKTNILSILCLTLFLTVITSCGSDSGYVSDGQHYNRIVSLLHTADGKDIFPEINGSDLRFVGFQSTDIARGFVSGLLAQQWDGKKSVNCDLHDYGTLKVSSLTAASDGVYGVIHFNLKGMSPFRLVMVTEPYMHNLFPDNNDGEDSLNYKKTYICPKCGIIYVEHKEKCVACGSELLEIPQLTIVPIPNLPLDDIDIDFDMQLHQ